MEKLNGQNYVWISKIWKRLVPLLNNYVSWALYFALKMYIKKYKFESSLILYMQLPIHTQISGKIIYISCCLISRLLPIYFIAGLYQMVLTVQKLSNLLMWNYSILLVINFCKKIGVNTIKNTTALYQSHALHLCYKHKGTI